MKKKRSGASSISTGCLIAMGIAGLIVANETGIERMNPVLGIFLLVVMGWAAVEMLHAMVFEKHPKE